MADSANLWDAFTAAILAGPALANPLGAPILDAIDLSTGQPWKRVYRGRTNANKAGTVPPPGYFLLGLEVETESGLYNGEAAQDGLYRIHCWGKTPDDARQLYRWLKRVLHGVPLAVDGYEPVTGILSKSGPTPDPDGSAWQIEATYEAEPVEV